MDELRSSGKPLSFRSGKYGRPIANRGAPGVDAVTLEAFEKDPQKNLYSRRIRRTSGCGSVVVDPTRAVAGPQLEMMRGDLGTEVIKCAESAWWRGHTWMGSAVRRTRNVSPRTPVREQARHRRLAQTCAL